MTVCDSSVWIAWFNGTDSVRADTLHNLLDSEQVIMLDIILLELLQGFRRDKDYKTALKLLTSLEIFPVLGTENALITVGYYRRLRKKGVTIRKTIDMMIAGWCIEHSVPLLHDDRDFDLIAAHLPLNTIDSA
jgi:predicted nucleic acid-binding protein